MNSNNSSNHLEISNFSSAIELNLQGRELNKFPSEIGQLKKLKRLNLSNNRIAELPPEIGNLSRLTHLLLSGNCLTSLPPEIGNLKELVYIELENNNIEHLPSRIGFLRRLFHLNLRNNTLKQLPENIAGLSNLIYLNLENNDLEYLPADIGRLENLEYLGLDNNKLTVLPQELRNLKKLMFIGLNNNRALHLPREVLDPKKWDLGMSDNEPAKPQDVIDYYFRTANSESPLNEAKLILIGFGGVGKTSLVNQLIREEFDPQEDTTNGIEITQWEINLNDTEEIILNTWDFGGQEIMHSTHQFFLTKRSLYLLVLSGRQGHEDEDAEYWLNLIQSFGGESPVIIVLNKIKERSFSINHGYLKQKFPSVKAFVETDCKDGYGIESLRNTLKHEINKLEHIRDKFPASWFQIKVRIANMDANYISYDKYRKICNDHNETDPEAQDVLALYLHTLGIALNYRNDPRLQNTNVLNPRWVTNGIYTAINAKILAKKKGELHLSDLAKILDPEDYPSERHHFLMELMHQFGLCFRFPEQDVLIQNCRYLVPDILDKQQPAAAAEFQPATCLNFQYHYPILPEGLLPRFIVRTHILSANQHRWRTGIILEFDKNLALVRADKTEKRVTISIKGPIASRRRLLAIIRSDFEAIHSSFKFIPKAMVPIPEHPDVLLPYEKLLAFESQRISTFTEWIGGDTTIELNVKQLLDGVDLNGIRSPSVTNFRRKGCHLFISYSHRDESLKNELETHLKLLERQGIIQGWSDREITPGKEWQGELDDNLEKAEVILLLITSDFLASDYCHDIEMNHALERHNAKDATVIPVICAPCNWKSAQFSKLQALPANTKPVTTWGPQKYDRDLAWTNVAQGIEQVAQQCKSSL